MSHQDILACPITAFTLLIEAWRENDEQQRDADMRAVFVAGRISDGEALETYIKKKNKNG